MTKKTDIRWMQRFSNLKKAFKKLEEAVEEEDLSELEQEGLIQRFEYTYELAWKTLQDLLEEKGYNDIKGPTPVIQQCFQDGYIEDGEGWMKLKKSREKTSHTYDKITAEEIVTDIRELYYTLFKNLVDRLNEEENGTKQMTLF
ncbi:MAG: nucleotidyltransferase [Bacteroidetes bacterium]|nr:nucleotidyltransferase [Bacteroidota bacterium]